MPGAAIIYVTDAPHNAKGDVKSTTGTITSGTSSLTVPSGVFVSGDIGKQIMVVGAGPTITNGGDSAVIPLYTTISNVVGTTVTLAATASVSVTNAVVQFGSDDTPAFQSAASAIQNQGGGELRIPPATYWIFPNSRTLPTNGTGAADFTSLGGVRVVGPGATLLTARAGTYQQWFNVFTFQDCTNVQVIGLRAQGHTVSGNSLVVQGANLVTLYGGCKNVEVQASATGLNALVTVSAGPRGGNTGNYAATDAQRSHGLRLKGVAVNCGYGFAFQFSGDEVEGALVTDACYRSVIAYGARDHRHRVDSRNHIGSDVLFQAYGGYGVANIDLTYTNRYTSNSYGVGNGTAAVELSFGDNTAAVHRDVRVHYDVKYLASQAFGPALRVINFSTNETPPIHQLERLRVEGRIEGPGDPFDLNFSNEAVSADRAHVYVDFRDFLFTDLTLSGTRPVKLDLTPLVDGLEINRVRGLMRGS